MKKRTKNILIWATLGLLVLLFVYFVFVKKNEKKDDLPPEGNTGSEKIDAPSEGSYKPEEDVSGTEVAYNDEKKTKSEL